MKALRALRAHFTRNVVGNVLEVAGLATATIGVWDLAGSGWALIVGGVASTVYGVAVGLGGEGS